MNIRFLKGVEVRCLRSAIKDLALIEEELGSASDKVLTAGQQFAIRRRLSTVGDAESAGVGRSIILESGITISDEAAIAAILSADHERAEPSPRMAVALTGYSSADVLDELIEAGIVTGRVILEVCEQAARTVDANSA